MTSAQTSDGNSLSFTSLISGHSSSVLVKTSDCSPAMSKYCEGEGEAGQGPGR